MLTFALFLSAGMGIYQETVYATHGKHPAEALFYNVRRSLRKFPDLLISFLFLSTLAMVKNLNFLYMCFYAGVYYCQGSAFQTFSTRDPYIFKCFLGDELSVGFSAQKTLLFGKSLAEFA